MQSRGYTIITCENMVHQQTLTKSPLRSITTLVVHHILSSNEIDFISKPTNGLILTSETLLTLTRLQDRTDLSNLSVIRFEYVMGSCHTRHQTQLR